MSGNVLPPANQDPSLFVWTGSAFAYHSVQYNLAMAHMVVTLVGHISNLLALAFLLSHKSLRKSPSTLIVMSRLLADACLTLSSFVTSAGMLLAGSWWYGKFGCYFNAFLNLLGCAFSILNMVSMTLERYYAIVKRRPWDAIQCYKALAIVTFHAVLTAVIPFLAQAASSTDLGYITRQPGGTYCSVAWWSNQPINIVFTLICALEIAICANIMNFLYFKIYTKVREVAEEQRNVNVHSPESIPASTKTGANQSGHESKSARKMERMILIKSVVIVVTFFALWAPFDVCVLYQAISGKAISGVMDGVTILLIQFQHCLTPFIVIFMDSRCTQILWSYWQQAVLNESTDHSMNRTENASKHSTMNMNTNNERSLRILPDGAK